MEKKLRIGIIGTGRISHVHSYDILHSENGVIQAICDIDEAKLNSCGEEWGVPEKYRFTNYVDLINCPEVDAVEICTPNCLHVPIAKEVIKAGKPVNVEKPIACSYDELPSLYEELEKNKVPNMMCFSYRFRPAVRYAKELMEKGTIGDIVNINIEYLQSGSFIPGRRLEWRHIKEMSGTGAIGDLGAHLVDMTRYLAGDITSVCAKKRTIVKSRKLQESEETAPVTTEDLCSFIAETAGGAYATFTVTRCAYGHSNTIIYDVYGTKGTMSFNLNNPTELTLCCGDIPLETGTSYTIHVPEKYNSNQGQTFIDLALGKDIKDAPNVYDGGECQKILDAVDKSAEEKRWVDIE